MAITLNGTTGITTPGETNTGTLSVTGIITASQGVGGTPAFSAYASAGQTLTNNTFTKVQVNTKSGNATVWDTNSNYDAVTNYRFLPTVAGYYQFTAYTSGISSSLSQLGLGQLIFYKNGASSGLGSSLTYFGGSTITNVDTNATGLIYCNGSTDYVELYARIVGNGTLTLNVNTYFQAAMVRSA